MSRIITSIILLMAMGFSGYGFPRRNTDNIDGGVVTRNSGEDSPKVIESTDIISFNCELSFIATVFDEENEDVLPWREDIRRRFCAQCRCNRAVRVIK